MLDAEEVDDICRVDHVELAEKVAVFFSKQGVQHISLLEPEQGVVLALVVECMAKVEEACPSGTLLNMDVLLQDLQVMGTYDSQCPIPRGAVENFDLVVRLPLGFRIREGIPLIGTRP